MTKTSLISTLSTAFLVAASLLVSGCESMSEEEFQQRTEDPGYNTVIFTDYSLNRNFKGGLTGPDKVVRLSSAGHGIERTDTGTSQVWLELRNHTDHNYMVEARTRFYSESGMPVDAKPVWQRVSVPANANAIYREKSVSHQRLQYRVEVRQAR